jgi:uncharacterized protein (TIGR02117 family)
VNLFPLPALFFLLAACAGPQTAPTEPAHGGPLVAVYLVAHEAHTGIALRHADIPAGLWPESRDFARAEYLEVGWGARDYYYGRDQDFGGTLRAIFPSASVLHVAGFRGPPAEHFPSSEIIELALSPSGFEQLVRYIHDAHARAGAAAGVALGPGLYGDSRFYPAWESFHLFRTCNVWAARGLRAAGVPVRDSITMEGLLSQAREIGKPIRRPRR